MEQILIQNVAGCQEQAILADRQSGKVGNPQESQPPSPGDILHDRINKYLYRKKPKPGFPKRGKEPKPGFLKRRKKPKPDLLKLIRAVQEMLPAIPLGFTRDNAVVVNDGTDTHSDKTKGWVHHRREMMRLRGEKLTELVSATGYNFRRKTRKWLRRVLSAIERGRVGRE